MWITTLPYLKSLHTLLDKCFNRTHAGKIWNRMIRKLHNFEFFSQNMDKHFWESVDAILEDISVTYAIVRCVSINWKTIIFHCSKNDASPLRVTRLKVAPNTVDPISLNESIKVALTYRVTMLLSTESLSNTNISEWSWWLCANENLLCQYPTKCYPVMTIHTKTPAVSIDPLFLRCMVK